MAAFTVRELTRLEQETTGKRFEAVFRGGRKTTRFGQPNATTWIDGASSADKESYLKRHAPRENWEESGRESPGYLSRWVSWGPSRNIGSNVRAIGGTYTN